MENPYLVENTVRLRVVLPCDRGKAWGLISTPEGYASWFPADCTGRIQKGEEIECRWWGNGSSNAHRVLDIQDTRFVEIDWDVVIEGARVRYSIEGDIPVTFLIEATYPQTPAGKDAQLLDIAPWAFAILNFKSIASGGVDLRNHDTKSLSQGAFLD